MTAPHKNERQTRHKDSLSFLLAANKNNYLLVFTSFSRKIRKTRLLQSFCNSFLRSLRIKAFTSFGLRILADISMSDYKVLKLLHHLPLTILSVLGPKRMKPPITIPSLSLRISYSRGGD